VTGSDRDGDGFTWMSGDCNDGDPSVKPNQEEICDGVDNDCDGVVDGDLATDASSWFGDEDGDGFPGGTPVLSCTAPAGYAAASTDCDDTDLSVYPGAKEVCGDGIDNDCDGEVDNAGLTFYADSDGDGYGVASDSVESCSLPEGYAADSGDCDDADSSIHPAAVEVCNDIDDDCDNAVDEDIAGEQSWHPDEDGDGYGDPGQVVVSTCEDAPDGWILDQKDCDDGDATVFPGSHATEVPADGVDQDCDGVDACVDLNCDAWADLAIPVMRSDAGWSPDSRLAFGPDFVGADSSPLSTNGAAHLQVADLDGDGYLDVIVVGHRTSASCEEGQSAIFWGGPSGHGDGLMTVLETPAARWVEVVDLDNDGHDDLVFALMADDDCGALAGDSVPSRIWWNDGARTFVTTSLLKIHGALRVDAADMDGDGHTDLVFCRQSDFTLSEPDHVTSLIVWNHSSARSDFNTPEYTEFATRACADQAVADLNDDGLLDLVFANYRDGNDHTPASLVYLNNGLRMGSVTPISLPTHAAGSVLVVDLDEDEHPEVIFGAYTDASADTWELKTRIYWGSGAGPSAGDRTDVSSVGSPHVAAADLDGDGIHELIVPGFHSDDAYSWEGGVDQGVYSQIYWGSDGYSSSTPIQTEGAWQVTTADLDDDDNIDLIFAGFFDGETYGPTTSIYWGGEDWTISTDINTSGIQGGVVPVLAP